MAGPACRTEPAGYWWAAIPKDEWPTDEESRTAINAQWTPEVGDARQELVLIGIEMDEPDLRRRLDDCLLCDSEMAQGPETWQRWTDPLPAWNLAEAAA